VLMAAAFSAEVLLELAGEKSYRRGEGYVYAVSRLRTQDGELQAIVEGSKRYRVRLACGTDGLKGECTCPYAAEGFFCKHLVAVGLAKLEGVGGGDDDLGVDVDEKLYEYLAGLEREELIDLLLKAATADEEFEQELLDAAQCEWS
jgi:uncharacterized Zn finger protein